jgi:hypothetical protein
MSACAHLESCPLFGLFTMSSSLGIWKQNYCDADWTRCARHQRASAGDGVPPNLLPNGRLLSLPGAPPAGGGAR